MKAEDLFHVGIVTHDLEATQTQLSSLLGYEWGPEIGAIAGVLTGEAQTVSRTNAMPKVPAGILREWASEQAVLLAGSALDDETKLRASAIVMTLGGQPNGLPVARRGQDFFPMEQLEDIVRGLDEIQVYEGEDIDYDDDIDEDVLRRDFRDYFEPSPELFYVLSEPPRILTVGDAVWPECLAELYDSALPHNCIDAFEAVLQSAWGTCDYYEEDSFAVGEVDGTQICRTVRIYHKQSEE